MSMPPKLTPWGQWDFIREIIPGVWRVNTPSHGGYWVSPEKLAQMPPALRDGVPGEMPFDTTDTAAGWFEEDEEANRVVLAFCHGPDAAAFPGGGPTYEKILGWAKTNWPDTVAALKAAGWFDRFKPKGSGNPSIKPAGTV